MKARHPSWFAVALIASLAVAASSLPPTTRVAAAAVLQEKIVDNEGPGFYQTGFERVADRDSYGGSAVVNPGTAKDLNFARYKPGLAGRYDVYLYWGSFPDKDTDVNWTVKHVKGSTTQPFNQRRNPGWHFHGSYLLDEESCVQLSITPLLLGGRRKDAPVVADAVKLVPTVPRVVERVAKDTITPVTLNYGDELRFRLRNGQVRSLKLIATGAKSGLPFTFWADLQVDGENRRIERVIPAQESFYEPLETHGLRIWLDAVSDIFDDDGGWMKEKDIAGAIACRPQRKARLAVNDVGDRICPETLVWWYPEKKDHIDVRQCYNGEDVWMGPFGGNQAHGGLDINMTSGTTLFAPIRFDDQYLYDSLAAGDNNNRWRGFRTWKNGSVWWLQSHHLNTLLVDEHKPLERGTKYALTAGVLPGSHQHTHFVFRVFEEGESYFLDPWILFWQTFRDYRASGSGESSSPERRRQP
jgi:hypothetical protein